MMTPREPKKLREMCKWVYPGVMKLDLGFGPYFRIVHEEFGTVTWTKMLVNWEEVNYGTETTEKLDR